MEDGHVHKYRRAGPVGCGVVVVVVDELGVRLIGKRSLDVGRGGVESSPIGAGGFGWGGSRPGCALS